MNQDQPLNINSLPQGSYTEETPAPSTDLNINSLPKDSYTFEPTTDVNTHATSLGIGNRINDQLPMLSDPNGGVGTAIKDEVQGGIKAEIGGTIGVAGGIQSLGKKFSGMFGVDTSKMGINALDSSTPEGQGVQQDLQPISQGERVGGALETVGELGAGFTTKGGQKVLSKLATEGEDAYKGTTQAMKVYKENVAAKDALDIVSPKLTPKETEQALAEGRGSGGGLFSKTKITPDARTQAVADTVKGIVRKNASGAENIHSVKDALGKEAESLKAQIQAVDHPYSFKELNAKLSKVEEPISLKGTPFEKQIGPIRQAAIDIAKKNGGTVSSLLDSRKEFDALVERTYPNLYEKENAPMRNAITAIRNGMNDFIEANLPKGNSYRDSLRKQSLFYDAIDNMAGKAVEDVKKTGAEKLLQSAKDHPLITLGTGGLLKTAYDKLRGN